ncbi:Apoptotic ATPase protein [Dioscorea alata]|uniref:Apoptotic ATPase protein n=1 Tax=Dioscorea alata TaxID=55571 RepID=A0ACB7UIJ5_DIOAL|nr:Apoptotic ATPase protein [Dioscorea alata]
MTMILDAFAETLVDRLANVMEEKVIMVLGVKTELQKLRRRMVRIGNVLKDAEKRRIQDETVKGWVDELKDVMYEADDIIDLCMIQGAGLLQDDHSPPKSSSCPRVNETPLNYVPKGIGKLEHLHHVDGLIIGNSGDDGEEGCNLEELQMLEKLSFLYVENLEKSSGKSSLVLSSKIHLRELGLYCTPNYTDEHIQQQEMDKIVQIFDELRPSPCLEDLTIDNFFGGRYPQWMSSTSITTALQELIYLKLINCSNCPDLPQLGQLPQLKYLMMEGATAVVSIGPEFLGNYNGEPTEIVFPKLEILLFYNMSNWEEWSLISGEEEDNEPESSKPLMFFPRLNRIVIEGCPKLKSLPSGLNRVNLPQLFIREAHSLSRVSHLPVLKELEVDDCPMLEYVEKLDSLQSLKVIDYEEDNTSLSQWLISFLQQREEKPHDDLFQLHLECSAQTLKGCLKGRPHWSFIQQVPRFIGYADDQHLYMKYTKEPYYYETNITDED